MREVTGTGIGMRGPHLAGLLAGSPAVPWLELLADNYLELPRDALQPLEQLRSNYGMTLHAVNMSVAGLDPIDMAYVRAIRELTDRLEIAVVSDHLCWTALAGTFYHDLLPVPFRQDTLAHVAERVQRIQTALNRPLVLENVSAYVGFRSSEMTEAEFLRTLAEQTGCHLLLDLNNLHINHVNLGTDLAAELDRLPLNAVSYIHLSGHRMEADVLVDTHDDRISNRVWQLFEQVLALRPGLPALIEWDHQLPPLDVLLGQQGHAEMLRAGAAAGMIA